MSLELIFTIVILCLPFIFWIVDKVDQNPTEEIIYIDNIEIINKNGIDVQIRKKKDSIYEVVAAFGDSCQTWHLYVPEADRIRVTVYTSSYTVENI